MILQMLMEKNSYFIRFYSLAFFSLTIIFCHSVFSMEQNKTLFTETPLKEMEEREEIRKMNEILMPVAILYAKVCVIALPFMCYTSELCTANLNYKLQGILNSPYLYKLAEIISLITIPTVVARSFYAKEMGKKKVSSREYPYFPYDPASDDEE